MVEVLLYGAIAVTVLTAGSMFMGVMYQIRVKNQAILEVEQQGQRIMRQITQSIRQAEAINSVAAGSLSLDAAGAANDPTIYDTAANGAVTAWRLREGGGAAVWLSGSRVSVSNVSFTDTAKSGGAATPGQVRVSFTLTYYNPSGLGEFEYAKTFTGSAGPRWP